MIPADEILCDDSILLSNDSRSWRLEEIHGEGLLSSLRMPESKAIVVTEAVNKRSWKPWRKR